MLWLIGMMGSGKSSVGAALAAVTGLEFVDTDQLIEEAAGSPIASLFAIGEEHFRSLEADTIRRVGTGPEAIVATGGGAVLSQLNRDMFQSGTTVWLSATPDTLRIRVGDGAGRPLLNEGTDVLTDLLTERAHLYHQAADLVIETDGCTEAQVVQGILDTWQR